MDTLARQWRDLIDAGIEPVPGWAPLPPATPAELDATERRLGRPLPPLLAAMLAVSGGWGWRGEDEDVIWLGPDQLRMGAPEGLEGAEPDEVGDGVEMEYGTPDRLNFAYSDARNFQVDFAPAAGGRVGQVVAIDPEMGLIDVVAESLDAFFATGLGHARKGAPRDPDAAPASPPRASTVAAPPLTLSAARAIVKPPARRPEDALAELEARLGNDPGSQALLAMMRASLASGDRPLGEAMHDADPDEDPEDDVGVDVARDASAEATLEAAARAFADAVKRSDETLGKRLRAGLKPAKARSVLASEGMAGKVPDALLPLFAVFDGQKGTHPLLPCPRAQSLGLAWKPLEYVCSSYSNEKGLRHLQRDVSYPPAPGVRNEFWHPGWIPLLGSPLDDGSLQAVVFADFAPAAGGTVGQVVYKSVRWANGLGYHDAQRVVLAPSLSEWLATLTAEIEAGRWTPGKKGFVRAA